MSAILPTYPRHYWLYAAILLLLPPALLIHLGLLAYIDDEAIRALVALEMKLSGNYITPTINGEYYYNKPPLYNWILLLFFNLTGKFNEFSSRLATVISLLGYAATVFYFFKKHYPTKVAFLNAMVLITCGRILFWDSMLGLIDTCFSWVMFGLFMVIYHNFQRKQWWQLFLLSYALTAVGFLMKGLPAIVFQGMTLLVYFTYQRAFKKLFTLPHLVGGLVFVGIVGSYYAVYHQYNALENVFSTLFTESSKRTVTHYGLGRTILHLFTFPLEMTYHFLPWSLLSVYFFRKNVWQKIRQDSFITFNLLTFLANIIVYWTSPEVYPRYLLMLVPLLFSSFLYLHDWQEADKTLAYRLLMGLFLGLGILLVPASFIPLFLEQTANTPLLYAKVLFLFAATAVLAWLNYQWQQERLLVLVATLLILRIGFNWFVLPDRNQTDPEGKARASAVAIGQKYQNEPLYRYEDTYLEPATSFYLTRERQSIVRKQQNSFPEGLYIILKKDYPQVKYKKVDELQMRHQKEKLHIIQLNTTRNDVE